MPEKPAIDFNALQSLLSDLCPNLSLALAEQLNQELTIDSPEIATVPVSDFSADEETVLQTTFSLSAPSTVDSLFYLSDEFARICVDLADGGDGSNPAPSLTQTELDKLSNSMTGLVRGFATALALFTGTAVDMETSVTTIGPVALPPVFALEPGAIQAKMSVTIGELHTADLIFMFTPDFVRALIERDEDDDPIPAAAAPAPSNASAGIVTEDELSAMLGNLGDIGGGSPEPAPIAPAKPAAPQGRSPFESFQSNDQDSLPRGLELIMDIPLDVTVELGRVRMLIKDVLELASGSIVELDRVAGEPVDLLVNGRLIAKGEVVVIEDNFGIRITEIISPVERVSGLGKVR